MNMFIKLGSAICSPRYRFYKGQIPKIRTCHAVIGDGISAKYFNSFTKTSSYKNQRLFTNSICYSSSKTNLTSSEPPGKESITNVEQVVIKNTDISKKEKLKKAVKEYGSTVIVFHVGISLISLGTCYILVSMGLDTTAVFHTFGVNEWASKSALVSNASTFAVAYGIHKLFAPVRITITLGSVPFIVQYLRKKGFLKK